MFAIHFAYQAKHDRERSCPRHGVRKAAPAAAMVAGLALCRLGQMQAQAASLPLALEPAKINETLAAQTQIQIQIQTTLRQRLTRLPAIDEIRPTQMPGLYEVRVAQQVSYTDAQGDFLIEGELIETRTMRNLTQERIAKLTAHRQCAFDKIQNRSWL